MSRPDDDSLMREIEAYVGSSSSSRESIDSEPHLLSVITATRLVQRRAFEDQPEIWELETGATTVVDEVRMTDQVINAVTSTSKALDFLPVNLVSKLAVFDPLRVRFQLGIPKSAELRLPT
ncbi:hypothetical protein ACOSQ2_010566 [Xanthoceras sorbifolium]